MARDRDWKDTFRDDEPDLEQVDINRRVMDDSTQATPFHEEIIAGDATYGEALYDQLPEDRVGFMPPGNQPRRRQ